MTASRGVGASGCKPDLACAHQVSCARFCPPYEVIRSHKESVNRAKARYAGSVLMTGKPSCKSPLSRPLGPH